MFSHSALAWVTVHAPLSNAGVTLVNTLPQLPAQLYIWDKTDNSSQSQTLVTLSGYKPGYALVMLVNNLPTLYGEQSSHNRKYLNPGEKVLGAHHLECWQREQEGMQTSMKMLPSLAISQ